MQNTWIWIVIAVVVIGGGFLWWQSMQSPQASVDQAASTQVQQENPAPAPTTESGTGVSVDVNAGATVSTTPTSATVTYDGSSFSPANVTIKKGSTVTFTSTDGSMWVASGPHPAHTAYSGTDRQTHCPDTSGTAFDQCGAGSSYSFTFQKIGTWPYHNHLNAAVFGKVAVVE